MAARGQGVNAVIFDMDGVLVDSEPLHHEALNRVLARHGFEYPEGLGRDLMGTTFRDTMRIVRSRLPALPDESALAAEYDGAVVELVAAQARPSPGARELVAAIRACGLPVALASSSKRSWVETTLAAIGLDGAFDPIIDGEMVTNGKPAPDIFLLAAQKLRTPPERCLVVEDSPKGVAAARAAGMRVVAVRTPYTIGMALPGAEAVLDSLADFDLSLLNCKPPVQPVAR